jgi:hypothetical protein
MAVCEKYSEKKNEVVERKRMKLLRENERSCRKKINEADERKRTRFYRKIEDVYAIVSWRQLVPLTF